MSRKDENFAIAIVLLCIGAIWMTIKFTVWLIKTTYPFLARLIKEKKSTTPTPKYHSWEMPGSSLSESQNHLEAHIPLDEPKFKFEQINQDSGIDEQLYHISMNIDDSWDRKDFDYARMQLQKIAYGMVGDGVNEEEREAFKRFMTQFAEHDPLYCEVMNILKPLLQQNKRLIQSTVYKHFPQYDAETLRYVLYFAHEIGEIYRVKKGRSYEITLIGETIEIDQMATNNPAFFERWQSIKDCPDTHPYALWITVIDPKTPKPCLELSDKVFRANGELLNSVVKVHFSIDGLYCRCRLAGLTERRAKAKNFAMHEKAI